MTTAWAPAILAVFALLFASSPVTALQTSSTPMAMLMAPADASGSDTPCDPVEMGCVRLCAVLCQGSFRRRGTWSAGRRPLMSIIVFRPVPSSGLGRKRKTRLPEFDLHRRTFL
jgi:hypothetical protein